jgi:hypothetical protein
MEMQELTREPETECRQGICATLVIVLSIRRRIKLQLRLSGSPLILANYEAHAKAQREYNLMRHESFWQAPLCAFATLRELLHVLEGEPTFPREHPLIPRH